LEPTPDILAEIKARYPGLFCVGFAAETHDLQTFAQEKRYRKGMDMIAANWVGPAATETDGAFGSETNALLVYWEGGGVELPVAAKSHLARQLLMHIAQQYEQHAAHPAEQKVVSLTTPDRH
jgi:phosphopantothenoylcysteine decarboxylase/phosphopantothenate--cysteine ligase